MADVFNAEEVLEMACQIERNGARYYRRAAELIAEPEASKLLRDLAAMEDDHELAFSAMKDMVAKETQNPGELTDEARAYLRIVADGHVFPVDADPAGVLKQGDDLMDILRQAVSMEKDSIVFYMGLREAMPAALGQDRINMIIREEMRHVAILSDRMSEVMRER